MPSIEITAKSLDEARQNAAAKLGVDPSVVEVELIEETKGLFGKTNLRVRATAPDTAEAAPAAAPAAAPVVAEAPAAEAPAAEKPKGRGGRGKAAKAVVEVTEAAPVVAEAAPAAEEAAEVVATEEDAERIVELVNGILATSGLDVKVVARGVQGKYVDLQIDGKDASHLVGKSGEILNHLQYLTNVILTHQFKNGVRSTLDGGDFRKKREDQLTNYATKIAEQVVKRGEEAVLDALPAFERRIIHKALQEISGIKTYSEGEEPNRRVVIAPAD